MLAICSFYKDRDQFQTVIEELDLTAVQKQIIQIRYVNILENFQKRSRKHTVAFFIGHFIITVGSLMIPALLSIQNASSGTTIGGSNFSTNVYWATFILSLLVTMCNGLLTLFKIDKKYYFLNTILERLRSEGWQYVGLTGRYSGHLISGAIPSHQNQFVFFTHAIEKIKMKQVEEEYYKTEDKTADTPHSTTNNANAKSDLYPPSPDQPIHEMATEQVPEPIQEAMNSLIKSQKNTIHNDPIPIYKDSIDP
jgi:hypothetical protein